jgi:hypothetical protein
MNKTVIETQTFQSTAREAGISDEFREFIVTTISEDPMMGDLMPGTGGCRKSRFAGRGKGKSGGYRVVHYNGPDDVPVLLLAVIDKGERDNLDKGERNALRVRVTTYAEEYRASVAREAKRNKEGA